MIHWITSGLFITAVVLITRSFRRMPWIIWFYQLAYILFLIISSMQITPLISFSRLMLPIFPIYHEIAVQIQDRKWKLALIAVGLSLSLICSAMFFLWRGDIM